MASSCFTESSQKHFIRGFQENYPVHHSQLLQTRECLEQIVEATSSPNVTNQSQTDCSSLAPGRQFYELLYQVRWKVIYTVETSILQGMAGIGFPSTGKAGYDENASLTLKIALISDVGGFGFLNFLASIKVVVFQFNLLPSSENCG